MGVEPHVRWRLALPMSTPPHSAVLAAYTQRRPTTPGQTKQQVPCLQVSSTPAVAVAESHSELVSSVRALRTRHPRSPLQLHSQPNAAACRCWSACSTQSAVSSTAAPQGRPLTLGSTLCTTYPHCTHPDGCPTRQLTTWSLLPTNNHPLGGGVSVAGSWRGAGGRGCCRCTRHHCRPHGSYVARGDPCTPQTCCHAPRCCWRAAGGP